MMEKSFTPPAQKKNRIRKPFSLFQKKSGALTAAALNMKQRDGVLVSAEGEALYWELPSLSGLLTSRGHAETLFAVQGNFLCDKTEDLFFPIGTDFRRIFAFRNTDGQLNYFALFERGLYFYTPDFTRRVTGASGGTCGCVHHDRLFTACGQRVAYSVPLTPETYRDGLYDAGYVDLPDGYGEILELVSFGNIVYCFRERGITRLNALADPLAFEACTLPCSFGTLQGNTVQNCGNAVLFFSADGLYSFDGSRVKKLSGCGLGELSDVTETASCGGKFLALGRARGETCMLLLDVNEGTGRLIRSDAEHIAGGDRLYCMHGGAIYSLTENGTPTDGCVVYTEPTYFDSYERKFLDAVTVEGKGIFEVDVRTGCDKRKICVKAGERKRLQPPLKGEAFSFTIRTHSDNPVLSALLCDVREVVQ